MDASFKTHTVANRMAAGGKVGSDWDRIARVVTDAFGLGEVTFTDHVGHGAELTEAAIRAGVRRVVVVGGDGTINEAVNGYMAADGGVLGAELALYPLGTGGDLARSLGINADRDRLIRAATTRWIDVGRVTSRVDGTKRQRYFLNVSSAGATGEIVSRVNRGSKRFGAKAAFVWGTVRGLAAYENQRVRIRIDDDFEEERTLALVAVANGRYFGGGMKVAPEACLNDGQFDVVVMGAIGPMTFVRHAPKIYRGQHGVLPEIAFYRGRRITLRATGAVPVRVEADGEVCGQLDAEFEVVPGGVQVLAPWERSEAIAIPPA